MLLANVRGKLIVRRAYQHRVFFTSALVSTGNLTPTINLDELRRITPAARASASNSIIALIINQGLLRILKP
jgi:hypothetical protein